MGKAVLIFRDRQVLADGHIIVIRVWRVPAPVPPTTHGFRYSLFYGRPGERLVCYDNERGKGDHRHLLGAEQPYAFVSVDRLLADFRDDVKRLRGQSE